MGHLNGFLARVGGNLNNNFQKSPMLGGLPGGGGMLKLRFDRYIKVNRRFLLRNIVVTAPADTRNTVLRGHLQWRIQTFR